MTTASKPLLPAAVVVDDHPLFRAALATLVQTLYPDAHVVCAGTAEEGLAAREASDEFRLVLLDFRLPTLNGAEAVRAFCKRFERAAVVVVSGSEDRREGDAAMRAGASAFLHKTDSMETLAQALRSVLAGRPVAPNWEQADGGAMFAQAGADLTARQLEILAMVCQGLNNKEIGLRLGLAHITVKIHVSAIFRVLGVVNRTQAALAARRLGLPQS
ncbi:response regulator transcription factor [Ramlibacter albus]|uniref:Response regulator transcription factor n=1 Tax=Ramlibacter albus TaxID=2079448 RepID=A0A923S374_9BURK|nr:response regulator transcription factor [Ramlibacter albus]MBC5766249.1 response regulator transcription factor [Ramlibacter albus]